MRKTSVQEIHFGDEPSIDQSFDLGNALNWYSMVEDSKKSKKYLVAYLKKKNKKKAQIVSTIPDSYFYSTLGWVARLLDRGAEIPQSELNWFNKKLKDLISNSDNFIKAKEKDDQVKTVRKSPIDLMKQSLRENIIGELDAVVDNRDLKFDVISFLKKNEVAPRTARYIKSFFQPELEYVELALKGDKLAKEYYGQSTKEVTKLVKVLRYIIDESNKYANSTRKPRKRTNQLKNFLYKQKDTSLNVSSINPKKLIGAKSAYIFDTKTRKLTYLVATEKGLDIKGTTFLNVDDEKTVTKTVSKNECIGVVQKLSKSKVRASKNVLNNIKTKNVRSPKRTTNNFIILSAF